MGKCVDDSFVKNTAKSFKERFKTIDKKKAQKVKKPRK